LTTPSLRSVAIKERSLKEHEVDVLGFHPPAEAIDREFQIIDDLIEQLRASTYEIIRLNREVLNLRLLNRLFSFVKLIICLI